MEKEREKQKIRCPVCGHPISVFYQRGAICRGVFFRCKNRDCRKIFELKL